ncbi:MAG: hypothetical protein H6627_02200 [Calditrichae bacterium]|nr:hypothetical protein [Calditrichia bacterium]
MKKNLVIISIIISSLGILITLAPFLLRVSGLDEPVKNYFIESVFAGKGHHLDLDKIEIGLGKFEISQVAFLSANKKVEVKVNEIVFDYNLLKLMSSFSEPQKAIREIYLNEPRIILHQGVKNDSLITDSIETNLVAEISQLYALNILRINKAQILYENKQGKLISYAGNLNGWLTSKDDRVLKISVKGNALAAENANFNLDLTYDKISQYFNSQISLVDNKIEENTLKDIVDSLYIDGTAYGDFNISGKLTALDSVSITGNLNIVNTSVTYKNNIFNNLNINLDVEDNAITIDNSTLDYLGNTIQFKGKSKTIFNPVFTGSATTKSLVMASFEEILPVELFNGSHLEAEFKFSTDLKDIKLEGSLSSRDFSFYHSDFDRFFAQFTYRNSKLDISALSAEKDSFQIAASGSYNIDQSNIRLNFKADYLSAEHVLFDHISNVKHIINASLDLNTRTKTSSGKIKYHITGFDTLLTLDGNLRADQKSVWLDISSPDTKGFNGKFKVNNYLISPNIEYATVTNFPFSVLSSDKILTSIFNSIKTEAKLTGTFDNLQGRVLAFDKTSADTVFQLTTNLKDILEKHKKVNGSIFFKNLNGKYEADFDDRFLGSYFAFDEGIEGRFFINLKSEEELQGNIDITNFKVFEAFSDKYIADDYRKQGEINGSLKISGTIKDPKVDVALSGEKFVLNEVGYYQPRLHCTIDRTKVLADTIRIFHNNYKILSGSLEWGLLSNQIMGSLSGDELDVPTLLKTFDNDNNLLTGIAGYNLQIKGTTDRPHLEADLKIHNGRLDGIEFDNIEVSLVDIPTEDKDLFDYKNHEIELQRFFIGRKGHYHLYSIGSFPLNSRKEVDLAVNFDGDILGLIPHWEPFFRDGASLADIALKFKGTTDEIKLVAAEIKLERGELWMKDVAKHISNISANMSLKEGTKRFNINNLTANVDDDFLKIQTVRNVKTTSGKKLEHWDFKGLDLDFGILAMETSGDGVFLNIPGLMQDEDLGRIHLSGKAKNETFYLAGPLKHPLAYGLITLNDATITYPFLVSNNPSEKPSTAVQFLTNMEWDVTLKAGEDVLYIRDLPAYIDNVHAEITVDENSQGLSFAGIIDKGTFKPIGSLESTRGQLEYLDQNFKVDRFALEFSKHKDYPDVSGRAWTTIRDSVGAVPKTIYLQLYAIDQETGQIRQSGSWEDFKFKLVSADPTIGETQEQVLAYLGYSVENFKEKATNVGGALTDKYLIRPLLRPIERALERGLGMDLVRFNSSIARNLFYSSLGKQINNQDVNPFINPLSTDVPYLFLMSSSEVTIGKYISEDLYLTYTGQLVSVYENTETGYDFNHSLGLEYRFFQNILLEFEWDRELLGYYNFENQKQYLEDFKIRLRHSFSF